MDSVILALSPQCQINDPKFRLQTGVFLQIIAVANILNSILYVSIGE